MKDEQDYKIPGLADLLASDTVLTGGKVNYYRVLVTHPQREDQPPYLAECEDIIEALELNPDEANIFKEIWRTATGRKGRGKPGHSPLYGAEKVKHYADRILRRAKRDTDKNRNEPLGVILGRGMIKNNNT